jgi:hypothetical protein
MRYARGAKAEFQACWKAMAGVGNACEVQ